MGKLIYGMGQISLDGYADNFEWEMPGEDLHQHAAEGLGQLSIELYGRKMYETMVFWETAEQMPELPPASVAFAKAWRALDKLVVSGSLTQVRSARTRIVPALTPDEVRSLKSASAKDISVSGPTLASSLLNAGLVDEVSAYFVPIVAGKGLPMFKNIEPQIRLEPLEEMALTNGFNFRRFAVRN